MPVLRLVNIARPSSDPNVWQFQKVCLQPVFNLDTKAGIYYSTLLSLEVDWQPRVKLRFIECRRQISPQHGIEFSVYPIVQVSKANDMEHSFEKYISCKLHISKRIAASDGLESSVGETCLSAKSGLQRCQAVHQTLLLRQKPNKIGDKITYLSRLFLALVAPSTITPSLASNLKIQNQTIYNK